ncbi:MAG: DUF2807 domain-containing protein [Saprospiraceae bacterium]|nr:DUF2807 domain-containing protein [Bacteroidia bacterium]NNE14255.1 DUF2807 domain-containing protein [Saprospiraceae bacterium]NNL91734.1 DUF2807 domain-containing protein [Saprospiraceae bacterium]
MKNIYILLLSFAFSITISAQQKETRSLNNFTSLKVSGGISVELLDGEPSAEIEVIKGEMEDLVTEVKGNTLYVKFGRKGMFNWNSGNRKAHVALSGGLDVNEIDVSAGAYVGSDDMVKNSEVDLDASSGGSIEIEIESGETYASASSGGSIKLSGMTKNLDAEASSGGSINGKKLQAKNVKAEASSGGSASVWVTDELEASASSGGSVTYKGDPGTKDIDVGKYSGGSVRRI